MNQLATAEQTSALSTEHDTTAAGLIFNPGALKSMLDVAEVMASGKVTIPVHLRGSKGDCLAVVMQAMQWGFNPFAVAQKTYLVNGVLGYEGQLIIAALNASPLLLTRINWEWFGPWEKIVGKFKTVESRKQTDERTGEAKKYIVPDWDTKDEVGLGVRASAQLRGEANPRVLELFMTQARTRNSTLWVEDPKQQLGYLAAKRWGRLHAPDVIMGVYSPDELEGGDVAPPRDMGAAEVVTPASDKTTGLSAADLAAWRAAAAKGVDAATRHWASMGKDKRGLATEAQKVEVRAIADKADKERTVDAGGDKGETKTDGAETKAAADEPNSATPETTGQTDAPATQQTGTGTDDFVADMDRADAAAAAAAGKGGKGSK